MTSDILFSLLIAVLSASPFMEQDLIDELLKEENRQQIEQELLEDFKKNPEEWNQIVKEYLKEE